MAKILKSNILPYLKNKTYLKAKIDELLAGKSPNKHAVNADTYGLGTTGVYGHVKTVNSLTQSTHQDGLALAANQGKVLKDLVDGKANTTHPHTKSQITDFPTTMTPSSHSHGSLANGGTINSDITSVNKIAVTDATNNLKTISKLPADKVTHQDITGKVDKVTGKGLSANDFTDALKSKLDNIDAEANKYTHPSSHASSMIVEASALANIGSAANANQHDINTKINTALGTKVDKVTGKGLSTNDFTDTLKSKLDSVYEGARAKKRILGYLITSDIDTTNQPLIRIQKDTRLKVRLYDSENGNIVNDLSGINFPINLTVNYCINNVNRSLTTTDAGATFNVGLAAGEYPVHFAFAGTGSFYPVYRSIILQVV